MLRRLPRLQLRWPVLRRFAGQYLLRDYQQECVSSCLEAFNEGKRRIGVSLATGGGKTVIFSHLVREVEPVAQQGGKSLVVVHRAELVYQAYERIKQTHPDLTVEIEMGENHASGMADVTVASVQSITRRARMAKFVPSQYKLLIIDEAHHAAASQYLKLLKYFGADNPDTKVAVAGFSATLYRQDGKSLTKAMDELVFHRDLVDMIKSGWLSNVHITTVHVDVNLTQVGKDSDGDFNPAALSTVLNTPEINDLVARTWSHHSKNGKLYKSTMVFCTGIPHSMELADTFRRYGIDARVVTSNTPAGERRTNVEEFQQGNYPVLVNCGVFTEGTDIPNIDMIIINRPTTSPGLLSQMIGRGLRPYPGKLHCHVVDMVGVAENTDIASTPALFRIDTETMPDEKPVDVMEIIEEDEKEMEQKEEGEDEEDGKQSLQVSKIKFETFDTLDDFLKNPQTLRPSGYSSFNWLPLNDKCYILSGRNAYVRLEQLPGSSTRYSLSRYVNIPGLRNVKNKKVLFDDVTDPKDAVVAADKQIKSDKGWFPPYLIEKSAKWRQSGAASSTQLTSIRRHCSKIKSELLAEVDKRGILDEAQIKKLAKGQASDLLSQFTHGGASSVLKWFVKQDRRREQLKKIQQFGPPKLKIKRPKSK